MTAETVLTGLVRINLIASVAIMLVLAVRPLVLRWLGASVAYWFWLVVPIAAAASLLPARQEIVPVPPPAGLIAGEMTAGPVETSPAPPDGVSAEVARTPGAFLPKFVDVLVAVWLLGAGALLGRSIVSTRRLAADPSIGPALVGVLRPRLVLPTDFEARFDAEERALILVHEEVHRISGHTIINGLVETARCACWFNPLAHLAATRFRTDQELACDAAVISARPTQRRAYAEALLKTHIAPDFLPLGCTWTSPSASRLRERIALLSRPSLSRRGAVAGGTAVATIGLALGYVAWAQQPDRLVTQATERPEAVWTPSAEAPTGVLTQIEAQRHDFFIGLARSASSCSGSVPLSDNCAPGGIDIVFFGRTATEMWWWANRGMEVWRDAFGSRKAVNFGSQGTGPESLLWRMRNGELDGYRAKLVVLQALDASNRLPPAELAAAYAPVIGEIRARQPQAKILIFAGFPRGWLDVEEGRRRIDASAEAHAEIVDDETVFYVEILSPDGYYNYDVWAEELQPWIDRFVR